MCVGNFNGILFSKNFQFHFVQQRGLRMDLITMILIESKLNVPLDVLRFMNGWVEYEQLNNQNIQEAVNLWIYQKEECLLKYGHIRFWNTSRITDLRGIFANQINFNEDISQWNVSNVRNMQGLFFRASSFNCNISGWNVSKVENMSNMFNGAIEFNCDISNWDVSNVRQMNCLFYRARKFNCNLNNWNIRNLKSIDDMFFGAISFDCENIQQWNLKEREYKKIFGYVKNS